MEKSEVWLTSIEFASETQDVAKAAIRWGQHGIPIFPCQSNKKPFTEEGYKDAVANRHQIHKWWKDFPDAMIGMPTGLMTGFWVLDVDVPKEDKLDDGRSTLKEFTDKHGPLPETRIHKTPSGGMHYLFKMPQDGQEIRNRTRFLPGLDARGSGGYIILPPSSNLDGTYSVLDESEPATAPAWLLELVRNKKSMRENVKGKAILAGATPFDHYIAKVAKAKPGTRNELLNEGAFFAGRLIAAGELVESVAREKLTAAALQCGLEDSETAATIESGLSAGMEGDGRPTLLWEESQLPQLIGKVIEVIAQQQPPKIYRHASGLIYLGNSEHGEVRIYQYTWQLLQSQITHLINWEKRIKSGLAETMCPKIIAENLIQMQGVQSIPYLQGITNTPILRQDGTICTVPGYDAESGLYFDSGRIEWPEIPELPDYRKSRQALARLSNLLSEFPFNEEHHRSVALAAILTGLVRHLLPSAPIFGFSSRMAGTGKTLLANIAATIATGNAISAMPLPRSEEELQKVITSVLITGQQFLLIDNVNRALGGDTLCALLTAETYQGRLLGTNNTPRLSTKITITTSGINLRFNGDLARRSLLCDMDAETERPEERKFKRDILEYVRKNRPQLVIAALTALRGYILVEDKPKLSPFGSFEEWSQLVRGCLVWMHQGDPCESQKNIRDDDPAREALSAVLRAWRLWQRKHDNDFMPVKSALNDDAIKEAMFGAIGGRDNPSLGICGKWLSKNKGNIVNGLKFEKGGRPQQAKWRVVHVED